MKEDLKKIEEENPDISLNIKDFALIKSGDSSHYTIFDIKNQNYIYIESYQNTLISLMIEKGVKIVSDVEEVTDPNFVRYMYKWDKEKNEFVKVRASNIGK